MCKVFATNHKYHSISLLNILVNIFQLICINIRNNGIVEYIMQYFFLLTATPLSKKHIKATFSHSDKFMQYLKVFLTWICQKI